MSNPWQRLPPHESYGIPWLLGLAYLLAFLLLDWASYIRPFQGLNITPWNPQPALAVALLVWNLRWIWIVWVGLLIAELTVRGLPTNWLATITATAALSLVYAGIARTLTIRLDRVVSLATRIDLLWFTSIVVIGAFFSGVVYVSTLSVMGTGPMGPTFAAISRYWIGDTVGLVVMLPMLLIVIDRKRRAEMIDVLKNRHWWAVAALICVLLWVIFDLAREDQFKFYYLLFLPVVWISARFGMPGAVLASGLTQLGLILAVQSAPHPDIAVFELQLLMAAITMTGLLLGVTVDERERAETALRGSLRLAAAGQMAAALAHELSQPLTALSTYAQACQILVASATDLHPDQRGKLENVAQRMMDDAGRAGNVIKRLRDFFRTGSTHLSAVAPAQILQEAAMAHSRRADALQIRIDSEIQEPMPKVWMDSVQIAVVLRNLIANAIDSASSVGAGGLVTIRATSTDRELEVEIQDSGPGVDKDRLHSLFEAGTSDKPGGMGLGLSICRAIVEAHGGKLWAEDGPGGKFRFTLPVENDSHSGVQGAP